MARHLAPFSCRQTIAEIVRRRSWGGVLPWGRHASISASRSSHAPSVSIALSSFQEGQNARLHNRFKREQALVLIGDRYGSMRSADDVRRPVGVTRLCSSILVSATADLIQLRCRQLNWLWQGKFFCD